MPKYEFADEPAPAAKSKYQFADEAGGTPAMTFRPADQPESVLADKRKAGEQSIMEGKEALVETLPMVVGGLATALTPPGWAAGLGAGAARMGPMMARLVSSPWGKGVIGGISRIPAAAAGSAVGSLGESEGYRLIGSHKAPSSIEEALSRAGTAAKWGTAAEVGVPAVAGGVQMLMRGGGKATVAMAEGMPAQKAIRQTAAIESETAADLAAARAAHDEARVRAIEKASEAADLRFKTDSRALALADKNIATKQRLLDLEEARLAAELRKKVAAEEANTTAASIAEAIGPKGGGELAAEEAAVAHQKAVKMIQDRQQELYKVQFDKAAEMADPGINTSKLAQTMLDIEKQIPRDQKGLFQKWLRPSATEAGVVRGAVGTLKMLQNGEIHTIQELIAARGEISKELFATGADEATRNARKFLKPLLEGVDNMIEQKFVSEFGAGGKAIAAAPRDFYSQSSQILESALYRRLGAAARQGNTKPLAAYVTDDPTSWDAVTGMLKQSGRESLIPSLRRDLVDRALFDRAGNLDVAGFRQRFNGYGQVAEKAFTEPAERQMVARLGTISDATRRIMEDQTAAGLARQERLLAGLAEVTERKGATEVGIAEGRALAAKKDSEYLRELASKSDADLQKIIDKKAERIDRVKASVSLTPTGLLKQGGMAAVGGLTGGYVSGFSPLGIAAGAGATLAFNKMAPAIVRAAENPAAANLIVRGLNGLATGDPKWATVLYRGLAIGYKANEAREKLTSSH